MTEGVKFKVEERENYTLVEFELPGPISPDTLRALKPPEVDPKKGVVISGRGPIWLYGFLVHHYHPTAWVATFDPRLGAVVVESHVPGVKPGDVINIEGR